MEVPSPTTHESDEEETGVVWCLICEQRPAEGTLRRLFAGSYAPISSFIKPVPRVCQPCADQVHGMPSFRLYGRDTLWEFVLDLT